MSGIKAGVVVINKFCPADSKAFSGYISYIDRSEAKRNEKLSEYNLYNDYMDNPEKTTGLFTEDKTELTYKDKKILKETFRSAQDNGSLMWQTVISFDNRWLEKYGLYDAANDIVDERKLKEISSNAIKKMLVNEGLENAVWSGAIHYNTDNLHVHVAVVEPVPQRMVKEYTQYEYREDPKGKYVKDNYGEFVYANKSFVKQRMEDGLPVTRYDKVPLLDKDGGVVKFSSCKKWKEKQPATEAYGTLKEQGRVRITKVERKESVQDTPLLYDLTTLQKEANAKHGFSAEKTLSLAQKLYEAKLVTYPRTGSRYIPEDVFTEIPALLLTLKSNPAWSGRLALAGEPTRRSVDAAKVTDHHALLITGMKPKNLLPDEQTLYDMIVGRMLEAFSEKCVKDVTTVVAECGGVEYTVKGAIVRQAGWRGVYNEETEDTVLPEWTEGEELPVAACSMTEGKTKPKPLHTEATLLAAMETAGKEIEGDELRQSLKECGIGTPATRAAIIETLFSREYMVRQKKSLVPTEKGLALYSVVKTMRIADVRMTGEWEAALAKIERGEMRDGTFREAIEIYTKQITTELLASDKLFTHKGSECPCPKCKTGRMQFFGKVVRCDNAACGLPVFRVKAGKTLSDAEITELLTQGRTGVIKGFNSKQGKKFSAAVAFDGEFNTVFEFPEGDKTGKSIKRRK